MLTATQRGIEHVRDYMKSPAPDLNVEFVEKVYAENVKELGNLAVISPFRWRSNAYQYRREPGCFQDVSSAPRVKTLKTKPRML